MDDIIKTTARFQEANQPIKQKPIIQITDNNTQLPNTIRSSIDSGRDNPFRPDGEIYKSADPIVDYYKYGLNQSRNQSPTDDRLLINDSANPKKVKKSKKSKSREEKESCWSRWLCCRCCCFCKRNKQHNIITSDQPVALSTSTKTKEKQQSSAARLVVLKEEQEIPIIALSEPLSHELNNKRSSKEQQQQKQQQLSTSSPSKNTKQKDGHANEQSSSRCVVS